MQTKLLTLLALLVVLLGLLEIERKPAFRHHGRSPEMLVKEADSTGSCVRVMI